MTRRSLRIALLASSRHPVRQPFAGGLEAFIYQIAHALTAAGHQVSLFAAPGSAADAPWELLPVHTFEMSEVSRRDPSTPAWIVHETHAYLSVMLDLADGLRESFDIVHNHSLHYLPLALARTLPMPMLTTLHTPPFAWLEQAVALPGGSGSSFAAVSAFTARQWRPVIGAAPVIPNGVDLAKWRPGPGGADAVWTGRLVPEKNVVAAIAAARHAGMRLRIAGPIGDPQYFHDHVAPELDDTVTYAGHLDHHALNALVGGSAVALVTPDWDEPYGLVTAEAMACGTPVAAFARGGLPEVVGPAGGRLARPGDIADLARAMREAATLPRGAVRAHAEAHCSQEVMVARYLDLYHRLVDSADRADMPA